MPAGRFSIVTEGFDAKKTPWQDYLQRLAIAAQGIDQGEGQVAATFLVADVDGELVGRSSIRHSLNERLRREGGHIGYRVLPDHRPRGYATADLRQSLVVTRSLGIERCLVTCADDSVAPAGLITPELRLKLASAPQEPGRSRHLRRRSDWRSSGSASRVSLLDAPTALRSSRPLASPPPPRRRRVALALLRAGMATTRHSGREDGSGPHPPQRTGTVSPVTYSG